MMLTSTEVIDYPVLFMGGSFGIFFLNISAAYLTIYVLTPRFLLQRKYWAFSVSLLTIMLFIVTGELLIEYLSIYNYHFVPGEHSYLGGINIISLTILSSVVAYCIGLFGASFTVLLQHWMKSGRRVLELENVSLHSELEQLKNQINPDFLFKMLDEAAKSAESNPERVSTLFTKLSKVLRYQLYDSTREKVLLHTDISFLENILSLQTIHSKGLSYSLSEYGDTRRTFVPPLLFPSFVEYIIKRIPENAEQTNIQLHFQIENGKLSFTCVGTGLIHPEENGNENPMIERVKRRLELLYHDLYVLQLTADESNYTIHLTMYV